MVVYVMAVYVVAVYVVAVYVVAVYVMAVYDTAFYFRNSSASLRIYAGVVPQHPPITDAPADTSFFIAETN